MNINWESIQDFTDIKYERGLDDAQGIAKITINRPEVRNSFRPKTVLGRNAFRTSGRLIVILLMPFASSKPRSYFISVNS